MSTILTVANLRKEKAHEVLLAAAARVTLRHPHVQFLIAGDGPRMAELRAMADTLRIAGNVRFLGHREDIPALLAEADAFVLPSRSEAFPNGAIEAMAAGLPVIAGAVGGLSISSRTVRRECWSGRTIRSPSRTRSSRWSCRPSGRLPSARPRVTR